MRQKPTLPQNEIIEDGIPDTPFWRFMLYLDAALLWVALMTYGFLRIFVAR
jgi:hypothetical protein